MRPRFRALALAAAATLLVAAPAVVSATPVDDGCPTSGALTSVADLEALGPYELPGRIDDPANGGNGDGNICAFPLPAAVSVAFGYEFTYYMFQENTRTEHKPSS